MSQSRYGGVAVPSAGMEDLSYGAMSVGQPPLPARYRRSTYQLAAGAGLGAAGVGAVNAARTYTNTVAGERAAAARSAAMAPEAETRTAARAAAEAARRDAARSTSQSRRQLRRATAEYQRRLPVSSQAVNRAVAAESMVGRTLGRRLKLAGVGGALIGAGALVARGGLKRRREGD